MRTNHGRCLKVGVDIDVDANTREDLSCKNARTTALEWAMIHVIGLCASKTKHACRSCDVTFRKSRERRDGKESDHDFGSGPEAVGRRKLRLTGRAAS